MSERQASVVLCVMPFCPVRAPNLGVSLLKSALEKKGYSTRICYFSLKLVQDLGLQLYDRFNGEDLELNRLTGEMVFSEYLFDKYIDIHKLAAILRENSNRSEYTISKIFEEIQFIRKVIPQFIEECAIEIKKQRPMLVGFSTSYYQTCASLSLAKRIKERMNVPIIFGGANCEGEMGYAIINSFPQVDFVCSGDGDIAFIQFVKCLMENTTIPKINGILNRESTPLEVTLTTPEMNLDNLPDPNFDDYFKAIENLAVKNDLGTKIVMETSRGCWWGELFHCKFCGLNGSTMKYRSKSPERVLDEMEQLLTRYRIKEFHFVDNILDPVYFKDLFPKIAEKNMNAFMFYETKANLSRQQLQCMKKSWCPSNSARNRKPK